ncbi:hypothetical protein ACFO3U_01080 [Flavobacterium ponti]|uniref:N-acetyltransferase domain-containing protein n=1 Tax=Flavobacterium ponti TaxID=665133 RepID=A0ABV9P0W3_9FLAO
MAIEYLDLKTTNNPLRRNYTILESNNEIGYITANVGYENILIATVNIFPEFQGKGKGFNAFEKIYNELSQIVQIETIRGVWCVSEEYNHCENGMSTNLNEFQKHRQTKSDEESAFLTPTGKWVRKLGFNKIKIKSISLEEVIVDFSR